MTNIEICVFKLKLYKGYSEAVSMKKISVYLGYFNEQNTYKNPFHYTKSKNNYILSQFSELQGHIDFEILYKFRKFNIHE